jgi:hypothetical protein
MLVMNEVRVMMIEIEALRLFWTIEPTAELLSDYAFSILRSGAEEGPFALIAENVTPFEYIDTTVNNFSNSRKYFYTIRITNIVTKDFKDYGVYYNLWQPDAVALELIRKKNVYLQRYTGIPAIFYSKKTFGQYCPNCWDALKQRKSKANCEVCYGTNFAGGYWNPISGFLNTNVPNDIVATLGPARNPDNFIVETSNYPQLKDGDFFLYPQTGKRYRIIKVTQTTRMGATISQIIQSTQINPNDIEYMVGRHK